MNTEREAKNPHSHLVIGKQIEALKADNATLQKRIEELEAVISKKDKALRKVKNSGALHGMASSSHEERQKVRDAVDNALALKAGDVQAPKEG